jgi:hypothetical protein
MTAPCFGSVSPFRQNATPCFSRGKQLERLIPNGLVKLTARHKGVELRIARAGDPIERAKSMAVPFGDPGPLG